MKLKCVIAGLVLSLTAVSASAATFEEAEAAVAATQEAGFPWLSTASLLRKAKKAKENNDTPNLEKFISLIMKETAASMYQAELAKKAGPRI